MSPNFSRPETAPPFRSRQAGSASFHLTPAHCSPASSFSPIRLPLGLASLFNPDNTLRQSRKKMEQRCLIAPYAPSRRKKYVAVGKTHKNRGA